MLDERKSNILRTVVEEYIETAQPVGSGHVAASPEVQVSPATVRNDMAVLETEGYLVQPHTSAGRIPTEKAYRYFVDTLGAPGRLGSSEAQQVRSFFARAHGELELMLQSTTDLLSTLTHHAAVVVGPTPEVATIRSAQLVALTPRVALLVVVLSNGVVDKHSIEWDADVVDADVEAASALLGEALEGSTLAAASEVPIPGRRGAAEMARTVLQRLGAEGHEAEHVFVGGRSSVAGAFDAVATVSEVLRILEQQFVVVSLMQDLLDRGLNVAIGSETGLETLADCAVVLAPYAIDGEPAGTIGVLGPTRMDYEQAMAAVAVVSRRLGRTLTEGQG